MRIKQLYENQIIQLLDYVNLFIYNALYMYYKIYLWKEKNTNGFYDVIITEGKRGYIERSLREYKSLILNYYKSFDDNPNFTPPDPRFLEDLVTRRIRA